jgi:hypothetical protein
MGFAISHIPKRKYDYLGIPNRSATYNQLLQKDVGMAIAFDDDILYRYHPY